MRVHASLVHYYARCHHSQAQKRMRPALGVLGRHSHTTHVLDAEPRVVALATVAQHLVLHGSDPCLVKSGCQDEQAVLDRRYTGPMTPHMSSPLTTAPMTTKKAPAAALMASRTTMTAAYSSGGTTRGKEERK